MEEASYNRLPGRESRFNRVPGTNIMGELTCAWLKTVVMLKHPGHFTSMKKLKRSRGRGGHDHKSVVIKQKTNAIHNSSEDRLHYQVTALSSTIGYHEPEAPEARTDSMHSRGGNII